MQSTGIPNAETWAFKAYRACREVQDEWVALQANLRMIARAKPEIAKEEPLCADLAQLGQHLAELKAQAEMAYQAGCRSDYETARKACRATAQAANEAHTRLWTIREALPDLVISIAVDDLGQSQTAEAGQGGSARTLLFEVDSDHA